MRRAARQEFGVENRTGVPSGPKERPRFVVVAAAAFGQFIVSHVEIIKIMSDAGLTR